MGMPARLAPEGPHHMIMLQDSCSAGIEPRNSVELVRQWRYPHHDCGAYETHDSKRSSIISPSSTRHATPMIFVMGLNNLLHDFQLKASAEIRVHRAETGEDEHNTYVLKYLTLKIVRN